MQHKSWEMGLFKKKIDNVISVKFWMTKERRGSKKKNTWKGQVQMGIRSSVFMYTWPISLSACELLFIGFAWLCDKLVQILVTVTVCLSLWVATLEEKNCIPNHILKTVDHSHEEIMTFGLCRSPLPFNTTPKKSNQINTRRNHNIRFVQVSSFLFLGSSPPLLPLHVEAHGCRQSLPHNRHRQVCFSFHYDINYHRCWHYALPRINRYPDMMVITSVECSWSSRW